MGTPDHPTGDQARDDDALRRRLLSQLAALPAAELQRLLDEQDGTKPDPPDSHQPPRSIDASHNDNSTVAVAGRDALAMSGDFVAQKTEIFLQLFSIHYQTKLGVDDVRILLAYLADQRAKWRQVHTTGLDPERSDPNDRRREPRLDRVYVDLNLRESRPSQGDIVGGHELERGRSGDPRARTPSDPEERTPWRAMEAAAHHERLVLLGEPGSGKSTFVRMLAFELAGRWLDSAQSEPTAAASIASVFARPLLPVLVTIRDFAHALAGNTLRTEERDSSGPAPPDRSDAVLKQFIRKELARCKLEHAFESIDARLRDGSAVLLLDGLDEVARADCRDEIIRTIEAFATHHPKTRVLVTCRIAAYADLEREEQTDPAEADRPPVPDWRLDRESFPVVTLAQFTTGQQKDFIAAYYRELRELRRIGDRVDPDERALTLLRALRRVQLEGLAGNPMLLSLMAFVHANKGELPDQRVLLYSEAVDTLLRRWRQGRAQADRVTTDEDVDMLLAEAKVSAKLLEKAIWTLTYAAHGKLEGASGSAPVDARDGRDESDAADAPDTFDEQSADITYHELRDAFQQLGRAHPRPREWAAQMIDVLKHRAGLLVERRDGVFTFPHRTIQEFLASRALVTLADEQGQSQFIPTAMKLRTAPNDLWREVILMAAGTCAHLEGNPDKATPFIRRLLAGDGDSTPAERVRDFVLAADVIREMTVAATRTTVDGPPLIREVCDVLRQGMGDRAFTIEDRARLGSAWGWIDDAQPGVTRRVQVTTGMPGGKPAAVLVPQIAWSQEIPTGVFPMGNDGEDARFPGESPRFESTVVAPYVVSIHPVTVAQYRCFIEAGGYSDGPNNRFWTSRGLEWRQRGGVIGPALYDEVFQTPNHPQVGVSWYEAVAFCQWLAETTGQPIRLPTESEWERAARGTDARLYPWGSRPPLPDPSEDLVERANVHGRIGSTTPVGLYPEGASPCGAQDMSGNVWEWCSTVWRENYVDYVSRVEDGLDTDSPRALRGGSWNDHRDYARCAYRLGYRPSSRADDVGFRVCVSPFSHSAP